MRESIPLSVAECERLLRGGVVGRIAFTTATGPHIVPVNYAYVGDAVVVRTSPQSVLGAVPAGAPAAFEPEFSLGHHDGASFTPLDQSLCYSATGFHLAHDYTIDLVDALNKQGLEVEHHYPGPGHDRARGTRRATAPISLFRLKSWC